MSEAMKASAPEEIGTQTEVIELPEPGPHGKMRVEVRRAHPAEILAMVGSVHDISKPEKIKTTGEVVRFLAKSKAPILAVAREVLVAPPFSFDAREEGKAFWGDLSWGNQLAIFNAAYRIAGLVVEVKEGTDAAAARTVARFPQGTPRKGFRTQRRRARRA